jgi:hypothetical protein
MKIETALKKYDARSPLVGNRFVAAQDGKFYIARLSKNGQGTSYSVRYGKTAYSDLADAIRALSGQAAMPALPSVEVIKRHLARSGSLVASHLYGDAYVITKPSPNGWLHYKARITREGVEVSKEAFANRGAALVQVQREGGPRPTLDLSKLPARPLGLYS